MFHECYICVPICICRLYAFMPSLFHEFLSAHIFIHIIYILSPGEYTYTKTKNMTAAQVLALLDWVPDPSAVTALRIPTRDSCNPNTCKAILKKLVAAKKKAKKSMNL